MHKLTLLLALPAALAYGQSAAPAAPQAPPASSPDQAAQAPAAPAAEAGVVGALVNELAITPAQAQGAAGALFGVAKGRLSVADFGKVAAAVPNMDALLKAAPPVDPKQAALEALTGKATASTAGGLGAVASVAGSLGKLGLKPETIVKLAPTLVKAVQTQGGAEVASLLAGALK